MFAPVADNAVAVIGETEVLNGVRNVNEYDLYSVDFTRSLPPTLKDDPEINALGRAIAGQLQITAQQIRRNIIYARIDELDEQTLDILAYDLHVDWYDHSYPIEVKRQTIKDSVKIHRRLGTKYAVETALGAVFPGTRVEEWFEYGATRTRSGSSLTPQKTE